MRILTSVTLRIIAVAFVAMLMTSCRSANDRQGSSPVVIARSVLLQKPGVRDFDWQEIQPYPNAVAACLYSVQTDNGSNDVVVLCWAVINGKLLRSYSELEVGRTYDLVLIPKASVPYMEDFPLGGVAVVEYVKRHGKMPELFVSERVHPYNWLIPRSPFRTYWSVTGDVADVGLE
jgi:hypothetical protein